MIKIIKLGNLIYENIEAKYIDEQGNEVWNIPNNVEELKQAYIDTLAWLEKQRLQRILDEYKYNGLADIQYYVSQNDTEAQTLLNWYQTYDDLIWNFVDNDLQALATVDELLALDLKQVEQQLFEQSVQSAPLP